MAPRAAVLSAFLLLGCFPPGEGLEPPSGKVYFPVGLAVDSQQKFLYIVNSDFDLQYNAGTVQSWDLEQLRARVPRYCTSNDDCGSGEVCDLGVDEVVENDGKPSHWCVKPRRDGKLTPCGDFGPQSDRHQALYPGRCWYISPTSPQDGGPPILPTDSGGRVVSGRSVIIGAFATDVVRRAPVAPAGWTILGDPVERLFIPVRGDATLHWIDIHPDGTMECGQGDNDGACDDRHRSGDRSEEENTQADGRMAAEPFGIDADENGLSVLVSNQTSGAVSLFTHTRNDVDADGNSASTIDWAAGPRYVYQEDGLPDRPIGVANLPIPLATPRSGRERPPGYLVGFRNAPLLSLIRVFDDAVADPARPYVRRYESEVIRTNSSGIDSRGIAVDASVRKSNEQNCLERFGIDEACAKNPSECPAAADQAFQQCLETAAATPLEVFVANRAPSSLIVGRSQPLISDSITTDLPSFHLALPLDVGPARVYVGEIKNERGERERRVFTLCFDSRRIAIYDPVRERVEAEIVTGRGPQGLAFDIGEDHAFAYIAHFLDSYVGVVDLDQRHGEMYGAVIATVARPAAPRASK